MQRAADARFVTTAGAVLAGTAVEGDCMMNTSAVASGARMSVQRASRTVQIPACDDHDGRLTCIVRFSWVCPRCGGPRGRVYRTVSFDGSRRLSCDGWKNPCGHIDFYSDVRAEAALGAAVR